MNTIATIVLLSAAVAHIQCAPQLISFKDGKIGVNFAGYHAAAGLGGLLGGGASGGLFAEAGTPYGQSARAGLGGTVDENGRSAGQLYAGATAGGNVKAEAGLGGGVSGQKSAGSGFATAQAGDKVAASGLGGQASYEGASGFTFSKSKSYGGGLVKEVEVAPVEVHKVVEVHKEVQPVEVIKEVKPVEVHKEVEVKVDSANEVNPLPLSEVGGEAHIAGNVGFKSEAPSSYIVKEVYVQPPPKVIEKEVHYRRFKPRRHHLHKTAFIGGYIGGDGSIEAPAPPPPPAPVVYKTKFVQPVIEKRVDVGVESDVRAGSAAHADVGGSGGGQFGYTKQVTFQRNPTFFADIFNIPISTLKAVGNFLGDAAGSTSVSVQKSASVQADKHESSKLEPSSASSSSEAHISVQTPNASSFIDDILSAQEDGEPTKVRIGRHPRKRANKHVVIEEVHETDHLDTKTYVVPSEQ